MEPFSRRNTTERTYLYLQDGREPGRDRQAHGAHVPIVRAPARRQLGPALDDVVAIVTRGRS